MRWNRFEEVVLDVHKKHGLKIKLEVAGSLWGIDSFECPSPTWDLNRKYRVTLASGDPQIQVLDNGLWLAAETKRPKK